MMDDDDDEDDNDNDNDDDNDDNNDDDDDAGTNSVQEEEGRSRSRWWLRTTPTSKGSSLLSLLQRDAPGRGVDGVAGPDGVQ